MNGCKYLYLCPEYQKNMYPQLFVRYDLNGKTVIVNIHFNTLINRLICFYQPKVVHLLLFTSLFFLFISTPLLAQDTIQRVDSIVVVDSTSPLDSANRTDSTVVADIHIYGNKVTKENTIRMYLRINKGDMLDSLKIASAKKRLLRTKLFSKVNLFSMNKKDGKHLYVVVTEHFYLIPDAGGSYYTKKYNRQELWFRVNASLAHRNFGGRAEEAKVSVALWDSRGLSLSWTKPLLPSDFYISSALAMDFSPSQEKHYNVIQASGKLVAGKDLFDNSKIAMGFFPSWNKQQWIDSSAHFKTTELYTLIGWVTDRRNHLFNPSRGIYFYTDVGFNHLYNKGSTRPYFETRSDLRLFLPGFFKDNVIAAHLGMTLRDNDAGPIHYLGLGGVKTIRGYPNAIVGSPLKGNNTFIISSEYRFPIFRLPLLTIPILSTYDNRFESVDIRIHGALIADFGRVGNTTSDLFNPKAHNVQSGSGLGGGIRILAPDFETNGCIDIVFPQKCDLPRGTLRYYKQPFMHLYLNFPY